MLTTGSKVTGTGSKRPFHGQANDSPESGRVSHLPGPDASGWWLATDMPPETHPLSGQQPRAQQRLLLSALPSHGPCKLSSHVSAAFLANWINQRPALNSSHGKEIGTSW